MDEGWQRPPDASGSRSDSAFQDGIVEEAPENKWATAAVCAGRALSFAHVDTPTLALAFLARAIPAIERAPGWAANYMNTACHAASASWRLGRDDHVEALERNIRTKIVAPDFRHPMVDGRLSLAHLCALGGRYDEAIEWFSESRAVLEEQGARPLLAIADLDQAILHSRLGDRRRAERHLEAAVKQFEALGMNGWLRRVKDVTERWRTSAGPRRSTGTAPTDVSVFRLERDHQLRPR